MRVLFLTHRLPYAPNRGDRARAHNIVRLLAPKVDLEVASLAHDADEAAQAPLVRELGATVSVFRAQPWANRLRALPQMAGSRPLTHMLLDAPELRAYLAALSGRLLPDVVLAYCSSMAQFALMAPISSRPFVLDMVDVDSAKWTILAEQSRGVRRWVHRREARYLSAFESTAAAHAHVSLVVNVREGELLRALAPSAAITVVPNGVDLVRLTPTGPPTEAPHVVFCGVMNYAPNVEGVSWFARNVWPLVLARRPDARFFIVGSDPVESVRHLALERPGITVTGTVPDVRNHLWSSAVSVAPLKTARGVQNKVLEAIAAGLPTVVTSQVFEGLPTEARVGCRVADGPQLFADETVALLSLAGLERRALAAQARLQSLDWESQLAPLYQTLVDAAGTKR